MSDSGNLLTHVLRNVATVHTCSHFVTGAAQRRPETLLQSYISRAAGPVGGKSVLPNKTEFLYSSLALFTTFLPGSFSGEICFPMT